jgi:hypothetical protein
VLCGDGWQALITDTLQVALDTMSWTCAMCLASCGSGLEIIATEHPTRTAVELVTNNTPPPFKYPRNAPARKKGCRRSLPYRGAAYSPSATSQQRRGSVNKV